MLVIQAGYSRDFIEDGGGSNGTAQYRICSNIILKPPILFNNNKENISTREDAGILVNRLTEILGKRSRYYLS